MGYIVHDIIFNAEDLEQLGTKEKFWFREHSETLKWLFKFSRENTGEHWSEKVAEQLCEKLKIPHVSYDLAICDGKFGIISPNVVPEGCRMVMGNEILHKDSPSEYPQPLAQGEKFVKVREHTITRVLGCLDQSGIQPPQIDMDTNGLNAGDVFCGYLLLDALISNQDRHHENWAIILDNSSGEKFLCPTYDHAASLGRELLDKEREERMKTKDENRKICNFVKKARSQLFHLKTDKKALSTVDAFFASVKKREIAKEHWLKKLNELSDDSIRTIFSEIPDDVITQSSRDFATLMVLENKKRLLSYE